MVEKRIRNDVDGLSKLINLPGEIEGVRWEHRKGNGGSSLVAVVVAKRSVLDSILRDSTRLEVQSPIKINKETSSLLFPREPGKHEQHAPLELRGVNIDPRLFIDSKKSGLVNGLASILFEGGFVYLSLYEM